MEASKASEVKKINLTFWCFLHQHSVSDHHTYVWGGGMSLWMNLYWFVTMTTSGHTQTSANEKKFMCLPNKQSVHRMEKKKIPSKWKKIIKLFSSLRLCDIWMLSIAGAFYKLNIYSYNNKHLYASFWEHRRDVKKRI